MAKSLSTKGNLFRLLNESNPPVYLLDPNGQILFANHALCGWIRSESETLEGLTCIWTTDIRPNDDEERVRGLAIPPQAFRSDLSHGRVFRTAADGHLIFRNAHFTRLDGSADVRGAVLVTVEPNDLPLDAAFAKREATDSAPSGSTIRDLIAVLRTSRVQNLGLDPFIGTTRQSTRLNHQIELACQTQCNLLIEGPAGSGREQLARAIFAARFQTSKTPDLIPIHGAVADAQLVQQVVMHVREQKGRVGGWILLLDADRLSLEATQEFNGLLELPNHQLHFLSTCTQSDELDPKLDCHINTLSVAIPALSNRKSDIPAIAELFLKQSSHNLHAEFNADAMELLIDYDWPGNLDELRQTIEAASKNLVDDLVTPETFDDRFHHSLQAQQIGGPEVPHIQLDQYLAQIESQLIERAMKASKNNKAQACKLLGISRAKLGRKIQQLGIAQTDSEPVVFEISDEED